MSSLTKEDVVDAMRHVLGSHQRSPWLDTDENGRVDGIGTPAMVGSGETSFSMNDNAEGGAEKVSSFHIASLLDAHANAGHELIPLKGKVPLGRWRDSAPLLPAVAKLRMNAGKNVGVRLKDTDLVFDVDPRAFIKGDDPLARLKADFDLPIAPLVRTGGGGQHIYFRKPSGAKLINGLPDYRGIEFKTFGRQVVAAGSIHPETSKPYRLDEDPLALSFSEAPMAPAALLDAITKRAEPSTIGGGGEITPEQLGKLLSKLNVFHYSGRHDDWLKIMMASHHATGGRGLDEFLGWSIADPDYEEHEPEIRRRWNSLKICANGVRLGTLKKVLSDAGHGAWIDEVLCTPPEQDFPNDVGSLGSRLASSAFTRSRGKIEANYPNTVRAIKAANLDVAYDQIGQRAILRADRLPWNVDIGRELNDDLIRIIREWVMQQFGFEPKREDLYDVLLTLATQNPFNPVVAYLDGLSWDGVARIDRLFPTYFGSEDSVYERAVGRMFLTAAVRRARKPGVKFDTVPILEGRQGSGKTSALRVLGGNWHSDAELGSVEGKEAPAILQGVWIMELGELTSMRKADVDHLKAFVSRTEDRFRPPYGKTVRSYLRRCVFVGTTNSNAYLRDQTGNRRYLPMKTATIDLEALLRDRDQLWAEASVVEASGESLVLPRELWTEASNRQGERLVDDPWLDVLRRYLDGQASRTRFSSQELMEGALGVPCNRQNQTDAKRVSMLMTKLGYMYKANVRIGEHGMTGYVGSGDPLFKA